MRRVSLSAVDTDHLISIILAHPLAGRHVAALLEDEALRGRMAAYTVVYGGHTVCMRVPEEKGGDDGPFLLLWSGQNKNAWRIDTCLLPRDWTELRQMARTAQTVREVRPELPGRRRVKPAA